MDLKLMLIAGVAAGVGFILFFSGRLQSHYGTLRPNSEVTRAYEQYRFDADMVYYSSGPEDCPRALIGIVKDFTLDADLWKQRQFNPETFRATVRNMQTGALSALQTLHGFDIVDHRNGFLGTWFSPLDTRTTIQILGNGRIRMDTPPPYEGAPTP